MDSPLQIHKSWLGGLTAPYIRPRDEPMSGFGPGRTFAHRDLIREAACDGQSCWQGFPATSSTHELAIRHDKNDSRAYQG
jgi:hypothetical protein